MSGAAYVARGASTGQAPTTVFFGPVPDKYTLLLPAYYFDLGGGMQGQQTTQTLTAANIINTWVPWDSNWGGGGGSNVTASIGSTTTAPDGTMTAYHVTENTSNNYHIMTAGTNDTRLINPRRVRLAVFAKAAERTRCYLAVGEYIGIVSGNNQESGVRCIFDLAGGQIGVPVASYNTGGGFPLNFVAVGSGMVPFGNGWYLCYIDVSCATNAAGPVPINTKILQAVFGPDSGSGTGAVSNFYTGNGTSGVYAWNTSMLPPRAWGMNTVSFFDDFLSLASIDVNNTLAPGFNWYCAGATWPAITDFSAGWQTPIPPGTLSVASSILTVPAEGGVNPNLTSAAYSASAPNQYVGNAFQPPYLTEFRGKFDYGTNNTNNSDELAWWSEIAEYSIPIANFGRHTGLYQEIDFFDSGAPGSEQYPITALLTEPRASDGHTIRDDELEPFIGLAVWSPAYTYSTGKEAVFNGVLYQSLINGNLNNQPDISPGDWSVASAPAGEPTVANQIPIDFAQLHNYVCMRIPDRSMYAPFDDTGALLTFFDGVPAQILIGSIPGIVVYGANANGDFGQNRTAQTGDGTHTFWIIGSGSFRNIYADYVRTIQ